jgi:hypothetical protein
VSCFDFQVKVNKELGKETNSTVEKEIEKSVS